VTAEASPFYGPMLMTEGMSIRAISRVTDIHKTTVLALLKTVGDNCARLFDAKVQNMRPRYVQADEAWTFVQKKQQRLKSDDPIEFGDQYMWIALDSETKAVLSYMVGKRDAVSAYEFIGDLSRRIVGRCQLTTDGLDGYIDAVEEHFGANVDFAQLVHREAIRASTHGRSRLVPAIIARRRSNSDSHHGRSGLHADFHVAHRTREPDRSDALTAVHASDEWVFKKAGEPESGRLGVHGVV